MSVFKTRASIDLGTNTCLLLVAQWDASQKTVARVIRDQAKIVRLGEGVDKNRQLQPAAMERTFECLKDYAQRVQSLGVAPSQVVCVATSQARDAQNSQEFFEKIKNELGFSFRVISGEVEAKCTFLGALPAGMDPNQAAVIDIGGGSTEMIALHDRVSLDLGSVRYTERFLKSNPGTPVTDDQFWACQDQIDQAIAGFESWRKKQPKVGPLVAVAGTATTLAAWHLGLTQFDAQKVDSTILTRGDLHRMVEELKWRTVEERTQLPSMEPLRADVILAGALILWRTLELLHYPSCQVSTRGLRYGVLSEF
jgi:exopolyphosphatase/guanosine-5'-triphosphate,3'-diphosphate pyrophosphatase